MPATELSAHPWFEAIGRMLDALDVGMCLFDAADRTQVWNSTFLRLFPEHEGQVHRGEPYAENLRRFYQSRLAPHALGHLERYVQAGIVRHQEQYHPFEYVHRGQRVTAVSLPLPGLGRLRLWRAGVAKPADEGRALPAHTAAAAIDAARLLDLAPGGLMLCDEQGRIGWANAAFAALYGLAHAQDAVGRTLHEVYGAAWARMDAGQAAPPLPDADMLQERMHYAGAPFELALPGGQHVRVVARTGAAGGLLYAHLDITELQRQRDRLAQAERTARIHAETALRESALLQAVLHGMHQGIAMVEASGRVAYHNRQLLQLLGLPAGLMRGRPLQEDVVQWLRAQGDLEALSHEALLRLSSLEPADGAEAAPELLLRRRSQGRVLEVGSVAVPGGGVLRTVTDVTERYARQQRIEHQASHDSLTGLLNRGHFLEVLAGEIALAQRTGAEFAVLYVDLDGFKPVNDRLGHAAGDEMLVHVGHRLVGLARGGDIAARLGGDEFALLQRGIHRAPQARALATRVRQVLQQPVVCAGATLAVGASVGVALYPRDGPDAAALLAAADRDMYRAKADGRAPPPALP